MLLLNTIGYSKIKSELKKKNPENLPRTPNSKIKTLAVVPTHPASYSTPYSALTWSLMDQMHQTD